MKGVILGLLGLAILVLAASLMTGSAGAEEDRYYIFDEPLDDGIVVYAGGQFCFTVEFENVWVNWSVEFSSFLFATWGPEHADRPTSRGDTFTWSDRVFPRSTEGIYDIRMTVNRSADSVVFQEEEYTFALECRYALNVTDFYIRRESSGQFVVIELDLHIPLDRLEVDLRAEGGNFEVRPDVSVAEDLPVGPTSLEGEIVLFEAQNGPPQIIFYDLVAYSGVHRIEMSEQLDDPEVRRAPMGWEMWALIITPIFLGVAIAILLFVRKRRKEDAAPEDAQGTYRQ